MLWNLFEFAPRKYHRPDLLPDWERPVVVFRAGKENVVVFFIDYMMTPSDSQPGLGHGYSPYNDVKSLTFDEATNEWVMTYGDIDKPIVGYFRLPDPELLRLFKENRKNMPSRKAMRETADWFA